MALQAAVLGVLTHSAFHWARPTALQVPFIISGGLVGLTLLTHILEPWSISALARAAAVYLTTVIASVVIYRLAPIHPLAAYPGPAFAKITKLWGSYNSWKGDQHHVWFGLHREHGSVIRTGPNEVSIADVRAVTEVFGAGGLSKGDFYSTRRDPSIPQNLLIMVGDEHDNRRRLWNRGMSADSLVEYEGMISKHGEQLVERLKKESQGGQKAVDIVTWTNYFTWDFMGSFAFGRDFHMLTDGKDEHGLWPILYRFAYANAVVGHIPWAFRTIVKLPLISRDVMQFRKVGIANAMARMKAGAQTKDLWYHLSDEAGLEKAKPAPGNVIADGTLATIAGSDTTASALASFWYFMASNPEFYQRLKDEVDEVYPAGSDATDTKKHSQLVWLEACLNETLRLAPPFPTGGPRQVPYESQGVTIAGRFIPPGTQVFVPAFVLHRDPRYFSPMPDKFLPARWLTPEQGAPEGNILNRTAFIPFSYGPANCVGRQLARMEMRMVISLLVQHFDFTFADGFDKDGWLSTLHDHMVASRGPLMLKVTERSAK